MLYALVSLCKCIQKRPLVRRLDWSCAAERRCNALLVQRFNVRIEANLKGAILAFLLLPFLEKWTFNSVCSQEQLILRVLFMKNHEESNLTWRHS